MRLLSITSLAALLAVVGAAGCSAIVDGDEYTSGGDGTNPHQRLVDVRTDRVAEWCDCFADGVWGPFFGDSADDCKARLSPSEDYAQCLVDVFDANPDEYGDTARCFVDAKETASECDERAACTPRGHQQCQAQLATSELLCEGEAPASYLEAVYQCASDHMVGPPRDTCPEEPLHAPLIVGANVGQGDDFNFSGSEDPMGDPCFWVLGGADDVIPWESSEAQNGDVIIDTIGSNYDTTLHLIDACETAEVLTCNDDVNFDDGIVQSRIRHTAAAGELLTVVVDAVSPSALGAYRLNFTTLWCVDQGYGPPVQSPVGTAAFGDDLPLTDESNMAPLGNDGDGACTTPELSGPEEVLAWRAPAAGTYTFDTQGSDVDTVLYARQSCDSDKIEVCNDDVSDTDDSSEVSVPLMRGETIILVVDTPNTLEGLENTAWQVNITRD